MIDKVEHPFQLTQTQLGYLELMARKHSLTDASKALRVLVSYAMATPGQEEAIFETIRCSSPSRCEEGQEAVKEREQQG